MQIVDPDGNNLYVRAGARQVANATIGSHRFVVGFLSDRSVLFLLMDSKIRPLKASIVPETSGSKTGFVLVNVPPSDGLPCRSRQDWKFYQRISSGTYPMEFYQIADMFGKRHRPQLFLSLQVGRWRQAGNTYERELILGMGNCGRAIARFPSLRFKAKPGINVVAYGIDGNYKFGLPQRPTTGEETVFAGGVDDVIYPGTTVGITKLEQRVTIVRGTARMYFEALTFTVDMHAEDTQLTTDSADIPEHVIS